MGYKLYTISDVVRVPPNMFALKLEESVLNMLREKYERKIDKDMGIVLAITNARNVGPGAIIHGDGASYHKVTFDALCFMPEVNEVFDGEVSEVVEFGAFVRMGPLDGLVHLSEVTWKRIEHPNEVLKVGQEVKVQVLSVERDRKRIALSMKRLEDDPWSLITQQYKIGQLVEGTVTKLTKFGAFARIKGNDEIEGLIHISELSDNRITHPKEAVQEGETYTLRVVKVEPEKRRIGLSLKEVGSARYADSDWASSVKTDDSPDDEN